MVGGAHRRRDDDLVSNRALLLPWVGAAIERLGARTVLSGGVVLLGAGAVGVSRVTDPWQLYAFNLVMGFGWAGASSTAVSTTRAQYFDRRLGLALSLALTGASAGGFAVAPGLIALSQRYGFPTAVSELTLALGAVILPLIFLCIRSPRGAAQHAGEKNSRGSAAARLCATNGSGRLRLRSRWRYRLKSA